MNYLSGEAVRITFVLTTAQAVCPTSGTNICSGSFLMLPFAICKFCSRKMFKPPANTSTSPLSGCLVCSGEVGRDACDLHTEILD